MERFENLKTTEDKVKEVYNRVKAVFPDCKCDIASVIDDVNFRPEDAPTQAIELTLYIDRWESEEITFPPKSKGPVRHSLRKQYLVRLVDSYEPHFWEYETDYIIRELCLGILKHYMEN
jgi:hypothetical protein